MVRFPPSPRIFSYYSAIFVILSAMRKIDIFLVATKVTVYDRVFASLKKKTLENGNQNWDFPKFRMRPLRRMSSCCHTYPTSNPFEKRN